MLDVRRQLFNNQLWETVAFAAKAAFLVLLTPVMLAAWGSPGYGAFALASSTFIVLGLLDCGIRPQLRIGLCEALRVGDMALYRSLICRAVASFAIVAAAALGIASAIVVASGASSLFGLRATEFYLIPVSAGMTTLVLLSGLLVEPLSAHGELASFKAANAVGSFLAIPAVYLCVSAGFGPTMAVCAWLAPLATANFALFACSRLRTEQFWRGFRSVRLEDIGTTLRGGFWFGTANVTWLAKTHGLTFIISLISGPAVAGTFFILLRLSEIIGTLCAVSSDAAIAVLARARSRTEAALAFNQAYRCIFVLSLHAALLAVLLGPVAFTLWLGPVMTFSAITIVAVAFFGMASAFNRLVISAAMGLKLGRAAAGWGALEACAAIVGVATAQSVAGFSVAFANAALATAALVPLAIAISKRMEKTAAAVWLQPLAENSYVHLFLLAVVAAVSWVHGTFPLCIVAGAVTASAAWQLFRPHSTGSPPGKIEVIPPSPIPELLAAE